MEVANGSEPSNLKRASRRMLRLVQTIAKPLPTALSLHIKYTAFVGSIQRYVVKVRLILDGHNTLLLAKEIHNVRNLK